MSLFRKSKDKAHYVSLDDDNHEEEEEQEENDDAILSSPASRTRNNSNDEATFSSRDEEFGMHTALQFGSASATSGPTIMTSDGGFLQFDPNSEDGLSISDQQKRSDDHESSISNESITVSKGAVNNNGNEIVLQEREANRDRRIALAMLFILSILLISVGVIIASVLLRNDDNDDRNAPVTPISPQPSVSPTQASSSENPSIEPTLVIVESWPPVDAPPSDLPSMFPSTLPSDFPSQSPTFANSNLSPMPSVVPSEAASMSPSSPPTQDTSFVPSTIILEPETSSAPSSSPSTLPSDISSPQPSPTPTAFPSSTSSNPSSTLPSQFPSQSPTVCEDDEDATFTVNNVSRNCEWVRNQNDLAKHLLCSSAVIVRFYCRETCICGPEVNARY